VLPAQVYKWRRLAELGVIGIPGASELPSFMAVEITKEMSALPTPVPEEPPTPTDGSSTATEGRPDRDRAGRRTADPR
jgi:transposase